jgi:hypothetical protein
MGRVLRRSGWASRCRACAIGAMVLVAGGIVSATASAEIIPGVGIGGLKLGDSSARVTALFGKPGVLQKNGGEQNWLYAPATPVDWVAVRVKGKRKTTQGIETESRKQRTSKGIGPGSSLSALKNAYPELTCKTLALTVKFLSCWILTPIHGLKVATNFTLPHGKPVQLVDIGCIGQVSLAPQACP